MEWLFLFIAILLETAATILIKISPAFEKISYSIIISFTFLLSIYFEYLAIKKIDLTLAYIIWVVGGIVLVSLFGFFYLDEEFSLIKIVSIFTIVFGVILFFLN